MKKYILSIITVLTLVSAVFFDLSQVYASTSVKLVKNDVEGVYYTHYNDDGNYRTDSFSEFSIDGQAVFCIEPYVSITTLNYVSSSGFVNSPYSDEVNDRLELIGHYGFDYPGHESLLYRMATQALIWETVTGTNLAYSTYYNRGGTIIDDSAEREEINRLINNHHLMPSFSNTTVNAIIGETYVLNDDNNILNEYEIYYESSNGNVFIDGNSLVITPTSMDDITVNITRSYYDRETTYIFSNSYIETQKLAYFRFSDPVGFTLKISVTGGSIELTKYDLDSKLSVPQGDGELSGAVYGVYDMYDTLLYSITTDNNHIASTGNVLNIGNYYYKEIKEPIGYQLDTNKYYFEITSDNLNQSFNVYDEVIKRKLELNKFFANADTGVLTPEVNIEFGIYNSDNKLIETVVTDSDGHTSVNLVYGKYTIKQHTTSFGHEMIDDMVIYVNENSPSIIKYSLTNAPINAKLKLVKIDSESKERIELSGIKFMIKNNDTNEYISQLISYPQIGDVFIFETTNDGSFTTPYVLEPGNYQIEEIESPQGYLLSDEPVKFTIGNDEEYLDEGYGKYIEVQFENERIKGVVSINKYGESPEFNDNDVIYNKTPLQNVIFEVFANEDIVTNDSVTHFLKDELVTSLTTDENGYATSDELELGSYYILEKVTDINHTLLEDIIEFELNETDNKTEIVFEELNIDNYYKRGTLEFLKVDATTGVALPNTTISITDEFNEILFTLVTDDEGKIVIDNIPVGVYKIMEIIAPEGYLVTDEVIIFEITEDCEVVYVEMKNEQIVGNVSLLKNDSDDKTKLDGAVFSLYNDNDELLSEHITVEGMVFIENLKYGNYYFIETQAPIGYELDATRIHFNIIENETLIELEFTNDKTIIDVPETEMNSYLILNLLLISLCSVGLYSYSKKYNDE